jgi:hypothetical protein
VTQTASAIQNPLTSGDSPISGPPSGVKEKIPLNPSSTFVEASAGNSCLHRSHAGAKSSSVNGSIDGIDVAVTSRPSKSLNRAGIGRCP